jgi:subtilisin family serine protease
MKKKIFIVSFIIISLLISNACFGASFFVNREELITSNGMFGLNVRGTRGAGNPQQSNPVKVINPIDKVEVGKDFVLDDVNGKIEIDVNDPGVEIQWSLINTQSYLVWDYIRDVQDETIYVAVLDTGVDYTHVDLKNRVDASLGYDFVNDDDDPMDDNGHGTHVSGIIAAEMNNEAGIVGIVGDLDIVIIPIKVLDEEGTAEADDIEAGIEYAIEQGADIINLSFGGSIDDSEGIQSAIEEAIAKDILVVAAAGNDGQNCDTYIPASVDGVYTVAASDIGNRLASFSNVGDCIEIVAPGEKIVSTVLDDGYEAWDGTSMAAPIVSGIAAMFKAYDPDLSCDEIIALLNSTASDLIQSTVGNGLVNAANAYEELTGEDIYDEDEIQSPATPQANEGEEATPEMNIPSDMPSQPNMSERPGVSEGPDMNTTPNMNVQPNMSERPVMKRR